MASRLILELATAQDWEQVKAIRLEVRSMRANQAFGFKETHRPPHQWPDGAEEAEVCYELLLTNESGFDA